MAVKENCYIIKLIIIKEQILANMYHEFLKIISILLVIVIYIIYLYNRVKKKNKCMDTPELIIKSSDEQKKINFSLGTICVICIILIIAFSIDIDFDTDIYTKIKILNLKQSTPVLSIAIGWLLWYFMNSIQSTIFYQHYIVYQGNFINWSDIYKVKRINDTKLKIYYKDKTNAYISILHSSEQKTIIDQIIVLKMSKETKSTQ